nr:leucine-rich repeat, cysteine-containing subtype [Tanacetum cinerariifolium]
MSKDCTRYTVSFTKVLEVLSTADKCEDMGLLVIGKFCKKLRNLTHHGVRVVTHLGFIVVAKACTNLESVKVSLTDISNEALECVGTHLKNLCTFHMDSVKKVETKDLLLDNGIQANAVSVSYLYMKV